MFLDTPWLSEQIDLPFPNPMRANGDIIAVGGNLSPGVLLSAYRRGIFPWFSEEEPILWWSLDPRFVLFPQRIHVASSLKKSIRKSPFTLSLDQDFDAVIGHCQKVKRWGQSGTWITNSMLEGYRTLHRLGYAHSVEVWEKGLLVGGLYGISLGGCFYGESMFTLADNAAKTAFVALTGCLVDAGFGLIDCQQHTAYLRSFGAIDMPREKFLSVLQSELEKETRCGNWAEIFPLFPKSRIWEKIHLRTES